MTAIAYVSSSIVFAQQSLNPSQQSPSNPNQGTQDMKIIDSGGSLNLVPADNEATTTTPKTEPKQVAPPDTGQPSTDSATMQSDTSVPQGEMEMPSNPDMGNTPPAPVDESVPEPDQGSVQN